MNTIFIDTSAFLAILDADDDFHAEAKAAWKDIVSSGALLFTSNYVLVETCALVQNRLGMKAIKVFN